MVRRVLIAALAAAVVAPASAAAKGVSFRITPSAAAPAVGDQIAVAVRVVPDGTVEDVRLTGLRLVAVSPASPVQRALRRLADGPAPRNDWSVGFRIRLRERSPHLWYGHARLPRKGRWNLVVPNAAPNGWVVPDGWAHTSVSARPRD